MLNAIADLEMRFRKSSQQQLLLETLLVRFALLDRSVAIEDVLRSLGGGDRAGGGDATRSSAGAERTDAEGGTGERATGGRGGTPAFRGASGAPPQRRDAGPPIANDVAAPSPRPPRSSGGEGATSSYGAEGIASATLAPTRVAPAPAEARAPAASPLDLNRLVERWDDVVERLRGVGKSLLATALAHATPSAVTARGHVVLELDEPNEFYAQAIEGGSEDLVTHLRAQFPAVRRVLVRQAEAPRGAAPRRLTEESVRAERAAALRKRDPLLGAAIDALDLDVVD
jgi:DNA polymerase-3 subunit gamma/tau